MTQPPNYQMPPNYEKPAGSKLPRTLLIIFCAVCLPCGILSYFGYQFAKKGMGSFMDIANQIGGCQVTYSSVRDAFKEYAREHDGKLPQPENWQKDIYPYFKKISDKNLKEMKDKKVEFAGKTLDFEQIKSADEAWGCIVDSKGARSGMAYNIDLAGKEYMKIQNAATTVLVFEIPVGKANAAMKYVAQDKAKSPFIEVFGQKEKRGWFVANVDGAVTMDGEQMKDGQFNFGGKTK